MPETERITYQEMCETIAEDYNKEGKGTILWDQVWNAPSIQRFPAIHVPYLYDAAKEGNLIGLLLTDGACAKIFLTEILDANQDQD